jgi:transcriptional regulator with XRE-family HTH domain
LIGERIKRVRIQLGLSQTQLAGNDLTRSFISQVENGRCLPSPQTLRKLADRLGKPVSYFLEEQNNALFGARFLWQAALADAALGNWASARPKLAEALQLIRRAEEPDWACDVQFLYARCLFHLGELEEALDHYEEMLDRHRATGNLLKVLETWLHMANCYLRLEQYSTARRLYQKVIRHSTGLKTAQELHARATLYLGSTHFYLGRNVRFATH